MNNSDIPAMPQEYELFCNAIGLCPTEGRGFTKREEIASRAMAGILANPSGAVLFGNRAELLVDNVVEYADMLLEKLEQTKETK